MKWYNFFSNFYDASLEKLYFSSRKRAAQLLDIKDDQLILDVACGTGANFKHIRNISPEVKIYGNDYSEGMIRRAKDNITKNGWSNIELFRADARDLNPLLISKELRANLQFDRIICALGLSVIPDWELVLDNMLNLLKKDGRLVVIDVFAQEKGFNTWLVEKIAKADLSREIGRELKERTSEFVVEYLPVKESKVGGKLFVASGVKSN